MSHFINSTTKPIQFFSYVLNMYSECELIVNVNTHILDIISTGNVDLNTFISFIFFEAKFSLFGQNSG